MDMLTLSPAVSPLQACGLTSIEVLPRSGPQLDRAFARLAGAVPDEQPARPLLYDSAVAGLASILIAEIQQYARMHIGDASIYELISKEPEARIFTSPALVTADRYISSLLQAMYSVECATDHIEMEERVLAIKKLITTADYLPGTAASRVELGSKIEEYCKLDGNNMLSLVAAEINRQCESFGRIGALLSESGGRPIPAEILVLCGTPEMATAILRLLVHENSEQQSGSGLSPSETARLIDLTVQDDRAGERQLWELDDDGTMVLAFSQDSTASVTSSTAPQSQFNAEKRVRTVDAFSGSPYRSVVTFATPSCHLASFDPDGSLQASGCEVLGGPAVRVVPTFRTVSYLSGRFLRGVDVDPGILFDILSQGTESIRQVVCVGASVTALRVLELLKPSLKHLEGISMSACKSPSCVFGFPILEARFESIVFPLLQTGSQFMQYNSRAFGEESLNAAHTRLPPHPLAPKEIIVDQRELRSSVPPDLYCMGANPKIIRLLVGDYILTNRLCVERKGEADLVSSIDSTHLIQQIEVMSRHYERPIVLCSTPLHRPHRFAEADHRNLITLSHSNLSYVSYYSRIFGSIFLYPQTTWLFCTDSGFAAMLSELQSQDVIEQLETLKKDNSNYETTGNAIEIQSAPKQAGHEEAESRPSSNSGRPRRAGPTSLLDEALVMQFNSEGDGQLAIAKMLRALPYLDDLDRRRLAQEYDGVGYLALAPLEELEALIGPAKASFLYSFFDQPLEGLVEFVKQRR